MNNNKVHQIIDLIYDAAINPSKWTDLMIALAEVAVQMHEQSDVLNSENKSLSVMPGITGKDTNKLNASISETLRSITNINEEETKNSFSEIGEVNDLLINHFARAIKIAKRLVDVDEQRDIVLSLLERMPIALVLVNEKAHVIETNAQADEMLSTENGLTVKSNELNAGSENNIRLLKVIEDMSKHDPGLTRGQSLSLTNEKTQKNIMLFIAPIKQYNSEQKASVAVFISQRKSLPLSLPKEFSGLYGLTNKELEVTEQLVRGLSINDISEKTNVTKHTVRSQVKSVLKKTDTSRQAELVSLVYNGMVSLDNPSAKKLTDKDKRILDKPIIGRQDYKVLRLSDGRNMAYAEYGDLSGEPVFHCHSVMGSRLELAFNADKICKQKSVRLIVIDRPGYGASDSCPEPGFINWTKDLIQLADQLNIERFSLTGYAMGGVYALACAYEIPERIKRAAIICSGAVIENTSDYETVTPMVKFNYRVAKYLPTLYKFVNSLQIKGALNDPDAFVKLFSEKMDLADKKIMTSDMFRVLMFDALREGFRQDGKSLATDLIQVMQEWGFEPTNIKVPLDIWHGTCDFVVPLVLAKRLDEQVENTRLFIKEGEGQYMFYTYWEEILDKLMK